MAGGGRGRDVIREADQAGCSLPWVVHGMVLKCGWVLISNVSEATIGNKPGDGGGCIL